MNKNGIDLILGTMTFVESAFSPDVGKTYRFTAALRFYSEAL